jgi:hypothetical protein
MLMRRDRWTEEERNTSLTSPGLKWNKPTGLSFRRVPRVGLTPPKRPVLLAGRYERPAAGSRSQIRAIAVYKADHDPGRTAFATVGRAFLAGRPRREVVIVPESPQRSLGAGRLTERSTVACAPNDLWVFGRAMGPWAPADGHPSNPAVTGSGGPYRPLSSMTRTVSTPTNWSPSCV